MYERPEDQTLIYRAEGDKRPSVWLVFTLSTGNNITCQAICTRPDIAKKYRDGIQSRIDGEFEGFDKRFDNLVRVWIETLWVNHLISFPDLEDAGIF